MLSRSFAHSAAAGLAALGLASGAAGLVIDDFSVAQSLAVSTTTQEDFNQVAGGMIGGERDGYLVLTSGDSATGEVVDGTLSQRETTGSDSQLYLVWDGPDNSVFIDRTGLGGVDLTVSGTQDALSIEILLNSPSTATTLSFLAYSSANDYSQVYFSAPVGTSTQVVLFASFAPLAGSGADFSNIGALAFFSDQGIAAQSLDVGLLQTTAVPEPSTSALVLAGLVWFAGRRSRARARRRS